MRLIDAEQIRDLIAVTLTAFAQSFSWISVRQIILIKIKRRIK